MCKVFKNEWNAVQAILKLTDQEEHTISLIYASAILRNLLEKLKSELLWLQLKAAWTSADVLKYYGQMTRA